MKNYIFGILVLMMFIVFSPTAQCLDTTLVEKEQVIYPDFVDKTDNPFIAQDIVPPSVDAPQKQNESLPIQHAALATPIDYGLVGAMALGIMGLLTYVIKSDRSDRKDLIGAINMLRESMDAQRQSNDRLSSEIHTIVKGFEAQINDMKEDMRRIEEIFRNEIRRS